MLIVLIILSILTIGILYIDDNEEVAIIPLLCLVVEVVVITILIGLIVNGRVIDQKIELLENKNKEIESKVEISVKSYMEYEGKTLKDLKVDSYIQLVNLYPELKSDKFIEKEIELYQKNVKEVNNLKMEKINISNYKWWVYFGR